VLSRRIVHDTTARRTWLVYFRPQIVPEIPSLARNFAGSRCSTEGTIMRFHRIGLNIETPPNRWHARHPRKTTPT